MRPQRAKRALCQVLDYRYQLKATGRRVAAVLAVETRPAESRWIEICATSGITLSWPALFEVHFAAQ